MITLGPSSSDLIRVTLGTGGADVEPTISYVVYDGSAGATDVDGEVLASITTTSATTIKAGATSTRVVIKDMCFPNRSATSTTILVEQQDGTNTNMRAFCTLLQNEKLEYTEAGIWIHSDANGAAYPSAGNVASQAEMEAAAATDKYVSPGRAHFHPGVAKFLVKCGVTANILASYNVTSLTDNGTGDVTVTIATDFATADFCAQVSVEMTATTYGMANTREAHVRSGGQAAGTLRCDCVDNTTTTSLIKDPTAWHISGLGDHA